MSSQIQITGETKVKSLTGVLVGTSGVVSSLNIDGSLGIPQLDVNGKIIVSQLPNSVMEYKGTWDASTNTPTLVNGTGNQGDVYLCSVAGTVNFGAGAISFVVSDQVIYSGSIWQKASGSNGTVTSVALTETGDSLNITGSPITTSGTINIGFNGTNLQYINGAGDLTTFPTLITSIGLSMPSAFSVANSPLTANGTIAVTGAGVASQYIRGDGTLANFPTSGGGGSSVAYYFNSSVSQGTLGGVAYRELSKVPIIGAGTDITIATNGYIANYITDAGDPSLLEIPAGNWNFEMFFSASSGGGSPSFYVELYKYDGTTFTLISSSSATPEGITNGTAIDLYTTALAVPLTTLTLTDRLAIRVYVNNSGRTITLHTENSHLCEVITTFSTGIAALNGLTAQVQYFQTGTSGTDFAISSATATHTFNLPVASAANNGKLSSTDWSTFNGKVPYTGATANVDLGAFLLTASGVDSVGYTARGSGTLSGYLILKQGTTYLGNVVGYNSINANARKYVFISDVDGTNYKSAIFELSSLTNNTDRTYTLPDASGTLALLESTQTFTGIKTFNLSTINETGIQLKNNIGIVPLVSGYTNLNGLSDGLAITNSAGVSNNLLVPSAIGYSYTFPAATGTIALTSQLTSGTVTSVAALTLGTSGTDLSSTVATSTTTPVITLNVPTASATNRGALSSADWTTFNSKESVLTFSSPLVRTTNTISIPAATTSVSGYLTSTDWTTFNNKGTFTLPSLTSGSVLFSNGSTIAQDNANFFWDDTNNRLGIGNAAPSHPLDVTGIIKGSTSIYATSDLYIGDTTGSATGRLIITDSSNQGVNIRRNNSVSERFKMFVGNGTTYTQDNCIILGTNTDIDFYTGSSPVKRLTIGNTGTSTFASSTASTSTTTGALVITGGLGIGGALFGTSATFSGALTVSYGNPTLLINGTAGSQDILQFGISGTPVFSTGYRAAVTSYVIASGSDLNTTPLLTIASTGAATFSSSITSTQSSGVFLNNSSGGTSSTQIRIDNTGGDVRMGVERSTGGAMQIGTSAYAAVFGNQANAETQFTTNGTVRMTITSGGNVGIGGSPSGTYKFEVTGTAKVSSTLLVSGAATFSSTVTSASSFNVLKDGSDTGFSGPFLGVSNAANNVTWGWQLGASNQLALFSYASSTIAKKMQIYSSGEVAIIGAAATEAAWGLLVNDANTGYFNIYAGGSGTATKGIKLKVTSGSSTIDAMTILSGGNVGIGTTGPSYQLQLSTDSAAKPTSALWTIASDERIKENINPYKKGLQELLKINPVTYDYNGLGGFVKGKGGVGIIAQEIIDILPDSVSSIKAKLNEKDEDETDILNFNGHELIYVLINSIKEQQAQIEELKALINK